MAPKKKIYNSKKLSDDAKEELSRLDKQADSPEGSVMLCDYMEQLGITTSALRGVQTEEGRKKRGTEKE